MAFAQDISWIFVFKDPDGISRTMRATGPQNKAVVLKLLKQIPGVMSDVLLEPIRDDAHAAGIEAACKEHPDWTPLSSIDMAAKVGQAATQPE